MNDLPEPVYAEISAPEWSSTIGSLVAALAKAQGRITGALKDSANPFFKSKYADLAACWDACRIPLSENELAVIQVPEVVDGRVMVITTLAHSSGEWVRSRLPMQPKDFTPQAIGSTITYARRYALAAMVGLAQVDDDAEAAQGRHKAEREEVPNKRELEAQLLASNFKAAFDMQNDSKITEIHDQANGDQELYTMAWKLLDAPTRRAIKLSIDRVKHGNGTTQ